MNRVEVAIAEGRCVLVFGSRVLTDVETLGELRYRGTIPAVVLGGDAPAPARVLSADTVAPALAREGGVIVLVEADGADGLALATLGNLVAAAAHKPRLVVVARAFNPFLLPGPLRLLKFEHEKKKPREFLQSLAIPAAPAPVAVAPAAADDAKKKAASGAPKLHFVGREEEIAALTARLEAGGPVALVGPLGIGRHWLLDRTLQGKPYKRLPDFHVGWGSEADSLYARLASFGKELGDTRLADAMKDPAKRPAPEALAALAIEVLQNPGAAEHVLVIDRLEHVLRRDGTFHREGRFELLLRALLVSSYALRVVFVTTVRPRFYREGEGANLQLVELGGLKGRELHELFEAYRVEDLPREHYGDIVNRIHGSPLAARLFAVAVRPVEERDELLENKRFMQLEGPGDTEGIRRRLRKVVEALPQEERDALCRLAHFRGWFTVADTELLEVDRKTRLNLLAAGLLDMGADDTRDRVFRVHPLVASVLDARATSDYAVLEALGNALLERARNTPGAPGLAMVQEGNRFLFEAHRIRNRFRLPYPDHDPALESVRGLVRSRQPRFDLAEQRIAECLKADPANTELLLMKAELGIARRDPPEKVVEVYAEAERVAPTPEVFHHAASFHQLKAAGRGKAAAALERGIAVFPGNARLHRRLAGIYVDQNRLDDAVTVLQRAMELEPMMPDTYGLLGEIQLLLGPAHYDQAEAMLAEARRLDPDNGLHIARLAALMFERGLDDEARTAQVKELLEQAITADSKNYLAHFYLGRLLVETGGDVDRAEFLFKKAAKLDEKAALPLVGRASVAVLKGEWAEADSLLDKATRLEPACHEAFYVRGEALVKQGFIFNARQEFQRALERSPRESKARTKYTAALAQCDALIESGQAIEIQKAAEAAGAVAPQPRAQAEAQRREPGKTTRRRRGGKEAPAAEGGDGAPAEAGETVEASEGGDGAAIEATEAGEPVEPTEADGPTEAVEPTPEPAEATEAGEANEAGEPAPDDGPAA